jgi:D-serine deaminase-like pyridoxal phosphate-dependent protein
MQLAAGAIGLTCAKTGEAEVMPGDDLLIGYPVAPEKLPRLRALARSRQLTVVTDSVEFARGLPGIGTLVEVDIGAGRCGVQTAEDAVAVAKACTDFRGLFYWPSWLGEAGFRAARAKIDAVQAALSRAGLRVEIVSGGSTPGAGRTPLIPQTTEIRPGTYVFYDASSMAAGICMELDCALKVVVTVVSTTVPGQCIIDGGSKTFSNDPTKGVETFGFFPGRRWTMSRMNEEHGYVSIEEPARIGEKVLVIPSHVCPAVNLHDEIWYGRDGRVEGSWRTAARGKIR